MKSLAQEGVYVCTQSGALALVDVNNGCAYSVIDTLLDPMFAPFEIPLTFNDIGFATDGFLYGPSLDRLFKIDPITAELTIAGTHPNLGGISAMVGLPDGTLLAMNQSGDVYIIHINPFLFEYVGSSDYFALGDLTYYNGNAYLTTPDHEIVLLDLENLANSYVVSVLPNGLYYGFFTFFEFCGEQSIYVTHGDTISNVNINTGEILSECEVFPGPALGWVIYGAASPFEFVPEECVLILDLDSDNSSGAENYDFDAGAFCGPVATSVSDLDAIIETSFIMDSLRVGLSGFTDFPQENVTFPASALFDIGAMDDFNYLITPTMPVETLDWLNYINEIMYNHTGPDITDGIRQISFIPYAENSQGTTATFEILVQPMLNFGTGLNFTYCDEDEIVINDITAVENNSGGVWLDADNNDFGNAPTITESGIYTYSPTAAQPCIIAFEVEIEFLALPNLDGVTQHPTCIGGACNGSIQIEVAAGEELFLNDEPSPSFLPDLCQGNYNVELLGENGCAVSTIIILENELQPDDIEITGTTMVCEGSFPITLTAPDGYPSASYLWQPGSLTSSSITVSSAGTYSLLISFANCQLRGSKNVSIVPDVPNPPEIQFCPGDTVYLLPANTQEGTVAWNGTAGLDSLEVTLPGIYTANYIDEFGCDQQEIFEVALYSQLLDFTVPNVFTPNGDGKNDSLVLLVGDDLNILSLKIFNRWGHSIFKKNGSAVWDGKSNGEVLPEGTYFYVLTKNDFCDAIPSSVSGHFQILK